MAKKRKELAPGFRTGRTSAHEAPDLVSPLGRDCAQTPEYSPDRAVEDGPGKSRRPSGSETQRNERRGG
mgnify:CR=1 FL=1